MKRKENKVYGESTKNKKKYVIRERRKNVERRGRKMRKRDDKIREGGKYNRERRLRYRNSQKH